MRKREFSTRTVPTAYASHWLIDGLIICRVPVDFHKALSLGERRAGQDQKPEDEFVPAAFHHKVVS
jgi:hypothetical protein